MLFSFTLSWLVALLSIFLMLGMIIGGFIAMFTQELIRLFHDTWLPIRYESKQITPEYYGKHKRKVHLAYIRTFVLPILTKPKNVKLVMTGEFGRMLKKVETPEFQRSMNDSIARIAAFEEKLMAPQIKLLMLDIKKDRTIRDFRIRVLFHLAYFSKLRPEGFEKRQVFTELHSLLAELIEIQLDNGKVRTTMSIDELMTCLKSNNMNKCNDKVDTVTAMGALTLFIGVEEMKYIDRFIHHILDKALTEHGFQQNLAYDLICRIFMKDELYRQVTKPAFEYRLKL